MNARLNTYTLHTLILAHTGTQIHVYTHAYTHSQTGEGQFGRVFKAIAEGICPYDSNRKVVAVKTLKGM